MKTTLKSVICITLFFTTIANAQWYLKDRIKGNGKMITEQRNTTSYDEINVSGFLDVELVSGKEGNISIYGEENIVSYIKIEVKGSALKIYTDKNISISTGKKLVITVPFESINSISLTGSGGIVSKNTIKSAHFATKLTGSGDIKLTVEASKTEASLNGSGNIILKGNAKDFMSKIAGSGNIEAYAFRVENADVSIAGSGDTSVFCTNNIKARVSGSGNIDYKGNPKTKDTKVNGSGDITQK
ncbi:head GIN domain-containing protein [Flavobacterium sp. K5-23]|uniref:head GIN domain-containing protein n=1 Tax=Flavobacterium sp. K5-23 TaxID=2746225 RepID=UPI002010AC6E|nr:head GIN domain-containing protein [Flavobacterium sp. K5-23]UQD56902.1 DUF2807 domain-containing protein [Flavobacterium sp. K5-23]